MNARCKVCGGSTEIHPGAEMLSCAYCGSTLVIETGDGPEHLMRAHTRRDSEAGEALVSFLASKGLRTATDIKIQFAYVPFFIVEEADGKVRTVAGSTFKVPGGMPLLPAGRYKFFEESLASGERVVPAIEPIKGTTKILHIPLYRMTYRAGSALREATVVGGSWQVLSQELPPERPRSIEIASVLAAAAAFVAFLFLGRIAGNILGSFALIAAVSGTAYFLLSRYERVMKR